MITQLSQASVPALHNDGKHPHLVNSDQTCWTPRSNAIKLLLVVGDDGHKITRKITKNSTYTPPAHRRAHAPHPHTPPPRTAPRPRLHRRVPAALRLLQRGPPRPFPPLLQAQMARGSRIHTLSPAPTALHPSQWGPPLPAPIANGPGLPCTHTVPVASIASAAGFVPTSSRRARPGKRANAKMCVRSSAVSTGAAAVGCDVHEGVHTHRGEGVTLPRACTKRGADERLQSHTHRSVVHRPLQAQTPRGSRAHTPSHRFCRLDCERHRICADELQTRAKSGMASAGKVTAGCNASSSVRVCMGGEGVEGREACGGGGASATDVRCGSAGAGLWVWVQDQGGWGAWGWSRSGRGGASDGAVLSSCTSCGTDSCATWGCNGSAPGVWHAVCAQIACEQAEVHQRNEVHEDRQRAAVESPEDDCAHTFVHQNTHVLPVLLGYCVVVAGISRFGGLIWGKMLRGPTLGHPPIQTLSISHSLYENW
ncbi:hypothetical protein B0H14DRAFT_2635649 [Mycena olivaceomarginata]|nr:hypothetical protein B0H14DRAFT_2635649 [Mycena olivaceomarginata]